MINIINPTIPDILLITAAYSVLGWIIEFFYRMIRHNKIINPGLLYGPFLPIYGLSALAIIYLSEIIKNNILVIITGTILVTLLEYFAGTALEKILGIKLWDYSKHKFNIKGRICLTYAFFWIILIGIFIYLVNPYLTPRVLNLQYYHKLLIISFLSGILLYDAAFTVFMMLNIKRIVEEFNNKENKFNFDSIKNKFTRLTRIMNGFPDFSNEIRSAFDNALSVIFKDEKEKDIPDIIRGIGPGNSDEYYGIVKDIIENSDFRQTRDYKHHHTSILEHSIYVSYYSYRLAKKFRLDYRSAARGALLHDYFLYDWRTPHPEKGKNHGREHPKTALRNAGKQFMLNEKEKDIILNHMWPYTKSFPKEKETVAVLMVDKYMASRELFTEARKKIGKQLLELLKRKKNQKRRKKNIRNL